MPTILVPALPKSAFNKHRPVSDLLHGQLKHFHHIELSLPEELRSDMTPRDYATEDGAARYIAHLTNALQALGEVAAPPAPIPIRRPARPSRGLAIAAAEEATQAGATPKPSKAKPSKLKSPAAKSIRPLAPRGKK